MTYLKNNGFTLDIKIFEHTPAFYTSSHNITYPLLQLIKYFSPGKRISPQGFLIETQALR